MMDLENAGLDNMLIGDDESEDQYGGSQCPGSEQN